MEIKIIKVKTMGNIFFFYLILRRNKYSYIIKSFNNNFFQGHDIRVNSIIKL